jgi:hypothetical protein
MTHNNSELGNAFPTAVRQDALIALAEFLEFPKEVNWQTFVVRLAGEEVSIPVRVYHDPELIDTLRLSALQKELVDCLLTRHHNDFVRQRHLERIICSDNIWIPPFVIQLIGEYVIDILRIIQHHQSDLNLSIYEHFVRSNPNLLRSQNEG